VKKKLRAIPSITLALVLVIGLVLSGCADESNQEGPALGIITGSSVDSPQNIQIGTPAPDFQFQNPDGQATSLNDLQGKTVLINFWQTRCPPCVHEMPYFQQVYDEWSDKGLVVLAINVGESSSKVKSFLQSHGLSLPVLLDTNGDVALMYNIQYSPTTFLIDKDGIIQGGKIGAFQSKEEIEVGIINFVP
jgi:peroxiredoxin